MGLLHEIGVFQQYPPDSAVAGQPHEGRLWGKSCRRWLGRAAAAMSPKAVARDQGRTMIAIRRAISDTERRFPVRVRVGVPPRGLGDRLDQIQTWLDANCGADGWAMAPAGLRGPLNDAIAIYFNDATLAAASVARWCAGYRVENTDGVFQIREDEPTPRISAGFHKTP